jgi:hypothetical protein
LVRSRCEAVDNQPAITDGDPAHVVRRAAILDEEGIARIGKDLT